MRQFTACMTLVCVGALAPAAFADKIRVPQDHTSIQAAVDAAVDGDEIVIKGRYTENVVVSGFNGLTLRGTGGTIDGSGGDYGVDVNGSQNVTVTKLKIVNSGRAGVRLITTSGCVVSKCRLADNGDLAGVYVLDSGSPLIEKCKIKGGTGDGVTFFTSTGARVLRCKITGVSGNGVHSGFLNGATTIEGNRIKKVGANGLDLEDGNGHRAAGNLIARPGRAGMFLETGDLTIQDNRIVKPGTDGIQTDKATTNSAFTRNTVVKPVESGIVIWGDDCVYDGNKVKKASQYGFLVNEVLATGNTIRNNKARKSGLFDLKDLTAPGTQTYTDNVFPTRELAP